jgi:hypothetical protein
VSSAVNPMRVRHIPAVRLLAADSFVPRRSNQIPYVFPVMGNVLLATLLVAIGVVEEPRNRDEESSLLNSLSLMLLTIGMTFPVGRIR